MKIHIFGASGTGTTTLGYDLSQVYGWKHLDADDYYWEKTLPPFQSKIPLIRRNANIKTDFLKNENCIISGSMVSWGMEWKAAFDLAVFLYVPAEVRLKRLLDREKQRYGELLKTDEKTIADSKAFIDWARKYDDRNFEGRSITQHEKWIEQLDSVVVKLEGDTTRDERVRVVKRAIEHFNDTGA